MKGQLGIEFMLISLSTMLLVFAMASAIMGQREAVLRKSAELLRISAAEGAARAIEAGLHGSGSLSSGPVGLRYRIEGGALHAPAEEKEIEIRGVFIADTDEPV